MKPAVGTPRVPMLDLAAQYRSLRPELDAALAGVLESGHFVMGPEVAAFERELAAVCGADFARGCASGSDAILLALQALGVGAGDEVVCPAFSFFASAGSIARLGAVPVFADVDPQSLCVTAETLAAAASGRRRLAALLPVHLFGRAAPLGEILELGTRLGVPVVEDAAQAIGARDADGQPVGGRSAAACFSFYPSKNLGAYGDAGAVTTGSAELAERVARLRQHGAAAAGGHPEVGSNSRLDALQAAVLRVKLRHLDRFTDARRAHAAAYDELFAKAGASSTGGTGSWDELALPVRTPPAAAAPARPVVHQYVIRVPERSRAALREQLARDGVETQVYYPTPLHREPCFADAAPAEGALPAAERAAREVLALPVHEGLAPSQLEYVVERVRAFFESVEAGGER